MYKRRDMAGKNIRKCYRPHLPKRLISVEKAKVLFSYEAENEDELSLEEGMVITILEKELEDSGWWKGEINGKIGVFPDNFVSLLPPEERPRKPPPPSLPPSRENKHGRPISQASIDKHDKKEDKKGVGRKPVQPPPPVVGKKPHKAADPKLIAQTDDMKAQEMDTGSEQEGLGGAEPSEKLSHPTAGRAKVPQRRPPGPKTREEREDKPAPPVARTARPAPPTPVSPKEEEPPKSPVVTPRSPASDITPLAVGPSVDPAVVEDLKRELEELRASTVSREEYQALQKQIQHVKEDSDRMRQQFNKRIIDLMKEVDEEKKTRLNMQVEIDRLKKLVLPDNDSVDF